MKRVAITTTEAPTLLASYSQAIKAGNLVFISGLIGMDPKSSELKVGLESQLRQCLANMQAVANAAGGSLEHVVKMTVYMTNVDDYVRLSEVMSDYFTQPYPARATVGVSSIPYGAEIELEAIMLLD